MSKPYKSITYVEIKSACPVDIVAIDVLANLIVMAVVIGIAVMLVTGVSAWVMNQCREDSGYGTKDSD